MLVEAGFINKQAQKWWSIGNRIAIYKALVKDYPAISFPLLLPVSRVLSGVEFRVIHRIYTYTPN